MSDFTLINQQLIDPAQDGGTGKITMNAGQTLQQKVAAIIANVQVPGTGAALLQDLLQRTVPAGKTIEANITINFKLV